MPSFRYLHEITIHNFKALNVIAEYDPKCQENLSKAIKLNPKLSEAWYQLGECHWKNNDIDGAFNCFKSALEYQVNVNNIINDNS